MLEKNDQLSQIDPIKSNDGLITMSDKTYYEL